MRLLKAARSECRKSEPASVPSEIDMALRLNLRSVYLFFDENELTFEPFRLLNFGQTFGSKSSNEEPY